MVRTITLHPKNKTGWKVVGISTNIKYDHDVQFTVNAKNTEGDFYIFIPPKGNYGGMNGRLPLDQTISLADLSAEMNHGDRHKYAIFDDGSKVFATGREMPEFIV